MSVIDNGSFSLILGWIMLVRYESFHVHCILALLLEIIGYGLPIRQPIGFLKMEFSGLVLSFFYFLGFLLRGVLRFGGFDC